MKINFLILIPWFFAQMLCFTSPLFAHSFYGFGGPEGVPHGDHPGVPFGPQNNIPQSMLNPNTPSLPMTRIKIDKDKKVHLSFVLPDTVIQYYVNIDVNLDGQIDQGEFEDKYVEFDKWIRKTIKFTSTSEGFLDKILNVREKCITHKSQYSFLAPVPGLNLVEVSLQFLCPKVYDLQLHNEIISDLPQSMHEIFKNYFYFPPSGSPIPLPKLPLKKVLKLRNHLPTIHNNELRTMDGK